MLTPGLFRALATIAGLLALLITPMAVQGQSVVPIAPQPPDLPLPGPFIVTTVDYAALPPNNHYNSTLVATGGGKTFGYLASTDFGTSLNPFANAFEYDSGTPQQLTFNFDTPFQLRFGDAPKNVFAVDALGNYVGRGVKSGCFEVTSDGSFTSDAALPVFSLPLPANHFPGGYSHACTGVDKGTVVGTATVTIRTQIPLNGGDGTSISGPSEYYQFPIVGMVTPLTLGGCCSRVRGFKGDQAVGDRTANTNLTESLTLVDYDPADSSPARNPLSSAFVWRVTDPLPAMVSLASAPSMAVATDGFRQGGWAGLNDGTGNYHAMLWSGTAASAVDLNPPGYFDTRVSGMTTEFQVGDGWLGGPANSPAATRHALLWHGSAESVVDLNQFLPPSAQGAEINGTDADGDIVGSMFLPFPTCPTCPPQQVGIIFTPHPSSSVAALTFDSSSVAPGGAVTGAVTLGAPAAAGGVSVNFTSSDGTLIPAPPSVFVPEGQTSVSFNVPTNVNTLTTFMAAPASATLGAHTAYTTRSATLTVTPATPADPIASLTLTPANVAPGDAANVVVTLAAPAPAAGAIVNFSSSNPTLLAGPASLLIPAGGSSASFSVVAGDANSLFFGPAQVILQGETGSVVQAATLTVARVPRPGAVNLGNPQNGFTSVQGGTSGAGFIPLSAAAQVNGTIKLTNTNPALILPASVPVQAGSWIVSVPWSTLPVAMLTTGTATATLDGFTSSDTLSVTASPAPTIQSFAIPVVSNTQTWSSGQTLTGTVILSSPAFLGGMTLSLTSDTPAAAQVPPSVAVPSGGTSVSFPVVAGQVAAPTTVNMMASLAGIAAAPVTLTVIPGPALAITNYALSPYSMIGPGVVTSGTVTLNQPAPGGGITIALSASSPAAKVPATVTLAQGQTSASFNVQGNGVSAATAVTLMASYKGVLAPVGTGVTSINVTVAPTDVLKAAKPTWSTSTHVLTVNATSTNPQSIITVLNANGNVPLGGMTNLGNGNYTFQTTTLSISAVNLKSNLGGATGQGVTVVP